MDTLYTELNWINQKDIKTVPEWIARIREQLSVAYAGLGMKAESDYNRNIYLDILYNIRQDKELESRYQSLEKESKELNALMFIVILGIFLIIILFWILNIYWKRKNKEDIIRLRKTLDICQKITAAVPADATSADDIIDAVTTSVHFLILGNCFMSCKCVSFCRKKQMKRLPEYKRKKNNRKAYLPNFH